MGAVKAVAEATRAAMMVYFILISVVNRVILTSCERAMQVMAPACKQAGLTHDVRRDLWGLQQNIPFNVINFRK